jgi:iron complex outermembrane receptor protein
MRRNSFILWSTSAMAVALMATPAIAQTDPAAQPDPSAVAQTNPADTAPAADAAVDNDTIVVTGLRRSLQSAKNIKKNSVQQIDAIVAEDIGKLPDIAVSDTAARIPGIQVERNGGEASRVLVRGLDRSYYTTTYNGREIFTAETRSVALQDFPAGGVAAVEAFKTSTADLVEPGVSGLINVRSRRPFDFKGLEVAGSVWGVWGNQARDFKPQGQILVSDRWNVGDGEMGALLNVSYTRLHYQDSVRRHGFLIAGNLGGAAGGRSPDYPELHYNEGDRWRPSVNGALQWRPTPDLELYAEGLWQGYREEVTDRMWQQPLWGGSSYSNLVVEDGSVISGTVQNPGSCCGGFQTIGFQGATKRHTDTYQFAVGGSYDAGPLRITADLARTTSTFKLRAESVDYLINTENYTVDWFTGRPGGSGPTFQISGLDVADPANYNYRGFFEERLTAKGKDWQGRLDAEYEPAGLDWLPKIQAGLRYVNRDATRTDGARYWDPCIGSGTCRDIPISAVPLDYQLSHSAFHGDSHKPAPLTWLAPTFNSVWDNLVALRQFNIDRGIPIDPNVTRAQNNDTNAPNAVPIQSFAINEKTLAGYAQLNYRFGTGEFYADGQLGMRVVQTKDRINGSSRLAQDPLPAIITPIEVSNKYTTWLPNLNLNLHFSRQWQLRLAATKTLSRPLFDQLNPALNLEVPRTTCDPVTRPDDCIIRGSGGNPFLKPLRSNNYDASLEYYFSGTGFASVAAFRRDLRGFIVNQTFRSPEVDATTGRPIDITGPVNTNKGRITGFEAQVSTFFDWDFLPAWARSFGAQANVTYLKPRIDLVVLGQAQRVPIQDVSKWTYNLVGMYENGPATLRLSYNHRSSFPEGPIDQQGSFTRQGRGNPIGRLDFSSSYNFNDNFTLFFDWTNILKKPYKSDIVQHNYTAGQITSTDIFPLLVRFEESVLSGGVRFRFGGGGPRPAAVSAPVLPPPPPPVVEPAPVIEQPAPPPPPPPASGERG